MPALTAPDKEEAMVDTATMEHAVCEAADQLGQWRNARKEHECWHCRQSITAGTRYFEYNGESGPWQSGNRFHAACAVAAWLKNEPRQRKQP